MNIIKMIREDLREKIVNKKNIKALRNTNFSILSSDCTGGVLSHDLGLQFNSPTINMYFCAKDYIKFIKDINRYLDMEMVDITCQDDEWPVAALGEIKIQLVHYNSVQEAQEAWNRRKARMNWNNMCVIMNDRNGCTEVELEAFDHLNYEHKVFFTCNREWANKYECAYYISKSEVNNGIQMVKTMTSFYPKIGWHRVLDEFDYVAFFNGLQ